jgi:hypothetical protein
MPKRQMSVTASQAHNTQVINGVMLLSVTAPAAQYVEQGNGPGVIKGDPLVIEMKPTAAVASLRRSKKRRKGITIKGSGGGSHIEKRGGRYFLVTREVKAHAGIHALQRAVFKVFGR